MRLGSSLPGRRPNVFSDFGLRIRSSNSQPIAREDYARYYHLWGGSFILHPEVLLFFEKNFGIRAAFRGYFVEGECVGAIPTWGNFVAGDRTALSAYKLVDEVDFGHPIVYLPISPGHACALLYRARYLLSAQENQIRGAFFTRLKEMAILKQIPEGLQSGKNEFKIKERRFERNGGTARNIQEFSNNEIVAIYTELFHARWGRRPHAIDSMERTLSALKQFLYGQVLCLKDRPIAIQINFRADTSRTICVDYINGGVDKTLNNLSPGSLLSYVNGRNACEESRLSGRKLVYSYGKANTDYKDQWCDRMARGFSGL